MTPRTAARLALRRMVPVACCLLAMPVLAIEPYTCRNGLFPSLPHIRAARVAAPQAGRVAFRSDDAGCPGQEACRERHYAANGSRLLVSVERGGKWACTWYFVTDDVEVDRDWREFVGWVPTDRIRIMPATTPDLRDWVGTWSDPAGSIRIERTHGGGLGVSARTRWYGNLLPSGERVVHVGSADGEAHPAGDRLEIGTEGACHVHLQWVDGDLVVHDNHACGGLNVTFDGVYQRAPEQP